MNWPILQLTGVYFSRKSVLEARATTLSTGISVAWIISGPCHKRVVQSQQLMVLYIE